MLRVSGERRTDEMILLTTKVQISVWTLES